MTLQKCLLLRKTAGIPPKGDLRETCPTNFCAILTVGRISISAGSRGRYILKGDFRETYPTR
jgi:hypothetical protein